MLRTVFAIWLTLALPLTGLLLWAAEPEPAQVAETKQVTLAVSGMT